MLGPTTAVHTFLVVVCSCCARPTCTTAPARYAPSTPGTRHADRGGGPPPLLLQLPQCDGIEMMHELSCCRALQARRYEHEYEYFFSFRNHISSTTPSVRERTVAAGRRQFAGASLAQSNAARPRHSSATPLEPLCFQRLSYCVQQAAQVDECEARKVLGVYKPMIWRAKMYTVHFVIFSPLIKYFFAF